MDRFDDDASILRQLFRLRQADPRGVDRGHGEAGPGQVDGVPPLSLGQGPVQKSLSVW